jgi:hypothetical protein
MTLEATSGHAGEKNETDVNFPVLILFVCCCACLFGSVRAIAGGAVRLTRRAGVRLFAGGRATSCDG